MTNGSIQRIYLAGPEVFWPDARAQGEMKTGLCLDFGFQGVYPLDNNVATEGLSPAQIARAIFEANIRLMDSCDAIIANMSPFRGPGMDGGTAFEMGYMYQAGKPVFGYSLVGEDYQQRVESGQCGWRQDSDAVEDFGLKDNLMMSVATGLPVFHDPGVARSEDRLSQNERQLKGLLAQIRDINQLA